MRMIDRTKSFKKDYKRLKRSGHHHSTLDNALLEVVALLAADQPLPQRHGDHPLTGNWNDHRDCHVSNKCKLTHPNS